MRSATSAVVDTRARTRISAMLPPKLATMPDADAADPMTAEVVQVRAPAATESCDVPSRNHSRVVGFRVARNSRHDVTGTVGVNDCRVPPKPSYTTPENG